MYNDDDFNEEEVENSNSPQNQNKILELYQANKKLIWLLGGVIIFILVFSIILGGGNNTDTPKNEVKLVINKLRETVTIGNTTKLYASVTDASNNILQNAVINWNSSDPSVATVDSNGIIKGIDYGSAIITVTYTDANGKIHTSGCEVVVAKGDPNLKITSVEFPEGELMMSVGAEYQLAPSFKPENGYVTEVKYTSYNKDVVEVDKNTGLVKALKVGKATITLDVNDGEFEDEIDVHVLEESIISQITINPTDIEFLEKFKNVELNQTLELEYDYQPFDANNSNLKWESSNPTVATVENGFVKGLSLGTAEITVTALNGVNDIMTVTVIPEYIAVNSVEILNEKNVTLSVGGTHTIVKDVLPGNASNKNVTFASSNSSVATVDEDGQVRAVSAGSATITVTSVDSNKTAKVYITVKGSGSGNTGGNTGGSTGGGSGSSSIGTLSYKASNGSTASISITTAKSRTYELPMTVSVGTEPISNVKICVAKCESDNECNTATCDKQDVSKSEFPYEFNFTQGNGLYVIKATKCANGNCVDVQDNYVNITSGATTENPGGSENPGSSTVEVTSISVPSTATKTVSVGSRLMITPTITPSNVSNKNISCAVDTTYAGNTGTVQVSSGGNSCYIDGKTTGKVRVKITSVQNPSKSTTVVIEVTEYTAPVYSFDDFISFGGNFIEYFTKNSSGTNVLEKEASTNFDVRTISNNLSYKIASAKYCFTTNNTSCTPSTSFKIGDTVSLPFPFDFGSNTGRFIVSLTDSSGKTYDSTYYVKYKVSTSINFTPSFVKRKAQMAPLIDVRLYSVLIKTNREFDKMYFCYGKDDCPLGYVLTFGPDMGIYHNANGEKYYQYDARYYGTAYKTNYMTWSSGTKYGKANLALEEKYSTYLCYVLQFKDNGNLSSKKCVALPQGD